jgi:hypothetical protein
MIRYLLAAMLVTSTGTAFAASGGSPNGKPFVEINGQIAEVQGQIATLEQRMDNLLARVVLNESRLDGINAGIALLQAETAELERWLTDVEAGLTSVQDLVSNLEAEQAELQAELDEFGDLTGELSLEIEANSMLISSLEASTADDISGLLTLIMQNQETINHLTSAQRSLEEQVALKQNLLNGTCAEGLVFKGFEDGTLVCEQQANADLPIEILRIEKSREVATSGKTAQYEFQLEAKDGNGRWVKKGENNNLILECPAGTSVVGGGPAAYPSYFIDVRASFATNSTRYTSDRWTGYFKFQTNRALGTATNVRYKWNPLWLPYVRGRGTWDYDAYTDPEDTLVISAFIQCAKASSPDL